MAWLINAAQADKFRKSQKSLIIFDASLHMPATGRKPIAEFEAKHIPGAKFFDIDLFSATDSEVPHTLILDPQVISQKLSLLGVRNDYKIIFYDQSDLHSAYRAVWMMKVFGHQTQQLYVLDGGLAAWEKYGGKIETGPITTTPKTYQAKIRLEHLRTLEQMKQHVNFGRAQIVDLRHPIRFAGGKEPRAGLRQGHMPRSLSFPYTNFFDKEGKLLPLEKIRTALESVHINPSLPTVTTCGSGITAPILDFILDLYNQKHHAVYDGSWSEWGLDQLLAGETDLSERPVTTCLERDLPGRINPTQ